MKLECPFVSLAESVGVVGFQALSLLVLCSSWFPNKRVDPLANLLTPSYLIHGLNYKGDPAR